MQFQTILVSDPLHDQQFHLLTESSDLCVLMQALSRPLQTHRFWRLCFSHLWRVCTNIYWSLQTSSCDWDVFFSGARLLTTTMTCDPYLYLQALWFDPEKVLRFTVARYTGGGAHFLDLFFLSYSIFRVVASLCFCPRRLSCSVMSLNLVHLGCTGWLILAKAALCRGGGFHVATVGSTWFAYCPVPILISGDPVIMVKRGTSLVSWLYYRHFSPGWIAWFSTLGLMPCCLGSRFHPRVYGPKKSETML